MSDPVTERYHDEICHGSPLESLSESNAKWLATKDAGVNAVVSVQRVRQENPTVSLAVAEAVNDPDLRPIVMAVAQGGGVTTYDDIERLTTASRRTVKRRVRTLRDKGVLDVDATAKPAAIHVPNDPTDLLIQDALSLFFSTTTTTN